MAIAHPSAVKSIYSCNRQSRTLSNKPCNECYIWINQYDEKWQWYGQYGFSSSSAPSAQNVSNWGVMSCVYVFCYRMKNMRVCFGNQVKNCKAQSSALSVWPVLPQTFLYFGSSLHMPYQQHFFYELQTFSCTSSPLIHFKSCAVPCRMSWQFGCERTKSKRASVEERLKHSAAELVNLQLSFTLLFIFFSYLLVKFFGSPWFTQIICNKKMQH